MKKKWVSALIVILALLTLSGSVLAYQDIKNPVENDAAQVMSSLGLLQPFSEDVFSQEPAMKRGEFAMLAVKMLGFDQPLLYNTFTIFPDVRSTLAEAPYINAAVRKYGILRGFPDGTFRPDETITYAQAITVYINMLGYTIADVGPFWPDNYLTKADRLGLSDGIELTANAPMPRSSAALLAWNLLNTSSKSGTPFLSTLYPQVVENALLLRTWQSSSALQKGRAEFSVNGAVQQYRVQNNIAISFVGSRGRLIFDAKQVGTVIGFLPDRTQYVESTVTAAYADRLELGSGTYPISRGTPLFFNGQLTTYQMGWYNVVPDQTIRLYYDDLGTLQLASVVSSKAITYSFIYEVNSDEKIPTDAVVMKNGVKIPARSVKKYDVVSYDGRNGIYYVNDMKLKGYYQTGYPVYTYPETVTVFNNTFTIGEEAAKSFDRLRLNQQIVLLFDSNGTVAGAFPAEEIQVTLYGVLKNISGDGSATVELLNGLTVQGVSNLTAYGPVYSPYQGYVNELLMTQGQLVTVSQNYNAERMNVTPVRYQDKTPGDWNLETRLLGETAVAENVQIFEKVTADAPLIAIHLSDIPFETVKAEKIRYTLTDSSGTISVIVLADVSGKGWEYGMLSVQPVEETLLDPSGNPYQAITSYRLTVRQAEGSLVYSVRYWPDSSTIDPVKVPHGMGMPSSFQNFLLESLEKYTTVTQKNFDGEKGLNMGSAYLRFNDSMQVYASGVRQFIGLAEARANYNSFVVYLDRPLELGGEVVILIAK